MTELLPPPIGPVLGYTTGTSARFMAGIQRGPGARKANCGWIRLRKKGASWQTPAQFRFNKNFYYTGVVEMGDLEPGTAYEYQIAYRKNYLESPLLGEHVWGTVPVNEFSTKKSQLSRFCFGSCLRGGDDDRVGKSLRNVTKLHALEPLDMMLWLGDQVYNDRYLDLTVNNSSKEDFTDLYAEFFQNPYAENILASMPNYMIMDDHEIEDDFVGGYEDYRNTRFNWLNRNKERLINGIKAFYSYQLSHGPLYTTKPSDDRVDVRFIKGQEDNQVPVKHYSEVSLGGCGLFLTDTRKERSKKRLISKSQERDLKEFLLKDYRVKFVASSVTFIADSKKKPKKSDDWKRAHKQRRRILEFIEENDIKNVVFLSGDVHSHFAAQLMKDGEPTSVIQLVSGSIYWPTSFIYNRIRSYEDDVLFDKDIHGAPGYRLSDPVSLTNTRVYANNGVGFVGVDDDKLKFEVLNHSGALVLAAEFPLR